MDLQEQLQQLQAQNDALIGQDAPRPDMGPLNQGAGIPDDETVALMRLNDKNERALAGIEDSTGSAFHDYLAGFNYQVGKAIPALIRQAQSSFPEDMKLREDIIIDAMKRVGISAKNTDTLANKIGQQNFYDLLTAAGMLVAGPMLATTPGSGVTANTLRTIGKTTMERPVLATAETLGAGAGQKIAEEHTGSDNPAVGLAGAMAGGMAVGAGTALGRKALNAAGKVIPGLGPKTPQAAAEALRPYDADPEQARLYSEQALSGAQIQLQKAVDDAIEAVPTRGSPEQTQGALRASIDRAERIGNRIVSLFWDQVPLKNPVPMSGIRQELRTMAADLADRPSSIPKDAGGKSFLERLYQLASPTRDPQTGKMVQSLPTIQRLRDFRGEIRIARKTMQASPAPNDAMIRNYNHLEGIIDNAIQSAYPNDRSIDQARRVSIMYHDLFSRGPIADVTALRMRGDAVVPPQQTSEKLMGTFGGMQSVVDARNKLVYKRAPGGKSFAVTQAERQQLQQLTTDAEDSIRSMFREAAAQGGPEAAAKFVGKHEGTIKALSTVHGELAMAQQKILSALTSQKALETSAIARYAATDPKYSFKRILGSAKPAAMAKEVLLTIQNDPQALAGFRASALDELITRTKGDPLRMRTALNETRTSDLYRAVLGPAGYQRLTRNTDIAYRIATGDEKFTTRHLVGRATLLGRIIGAQAGRVTSQMLGGGTIQVPGLMASSFGRAVERFLKAANPQELLVQSIIDPKWERLLLIREPRTTLEARKALKTMRRALSTIEFTQQSLHNRLSEGDD